MKQPWGTASLIARPAPTPTDGPPGVSIIINGSAGLVPALTQEEEEMVLSTNGRERGGHREQEW